MSDPRDPSDPPRTEGQDAVEDDSTEEVPAGGAGADTGASDAVRVDPDDEAEIPDRSPHNDEPGVGTRGGSHRDPGA